MQIAGQVACEVRTLPKSSVALDITVPADISNKVHQAVLTELGKNANVPGFRKGKAPPEALLNHVGIHKVKKATVEEIIDLGMKQSAQQVQVRAAGEARLESSVDSVADSYSLGEQLKFTVLLDVFPEIELKEESYKGLKVQVERVPFNDEAYDMSLFKLRDQNANLYDAETGRAAEQGDQIFANMAGFFCEADGSKGEKLPDVAGGDAVEIPLVEGRFMFGLSESMVGIKQDEVREAKVTFPSRTSIPQLAGREAIFEVTCLKVQTRELPECDDAFAEKVMAGLTWEALDAKLREGVQEEVDSQQTISIHRMLERALVKVLPASLELPESIVDEVTKERFAATLADQRQRGVTDEKLKELVSPENYKKYAAVARPSIEASIKGDFALKELGRQQNLVVSEDEVEDEMMTLQAQALQRGEKFKPSEVKPNVEAQIEKKMYLNYLQSVSEIILTDEEVETLDDLLGATPEQLAQSVKDAGVEVESILEPTDGAAAVVEAAPEPAPPPAPAPAPPSPPPPAPKPVAEAAAEDDVVAGPPDGFQWGDKTF